MLKQAEASDNRDRINIPGGEASLYGQFCPIAMAAELLATRWTLVVLGEMLSGSTRFNDIRRGVPRMSSALLAKRLRELEDAGVLDHVDGEYTLTRSGRDLAPIIQGIGRWALRWVDSDCSLANLDPRQRTRRSDAIAALSRLAIRPGNIRAGLIGRGIVCAKCATR